MTCRELVELVTAYFDDALPNGVRERFEAHVAGCDGCTEYLRQMRAAIVLAGATRSLAERPEVAGLLAAFRGFR